MNVSILSSDELLELRSDLPHRAVSMICKKTGYSRWLVSQVLNGKYPKETEGKQKIIEAAINILDSRNELRQRFEQLKSKSA